MKMRRFPSYVIFSLVLIVLIISLWNIGVRSQEPAAEPQWPMKDGSPQRTGRSPYSCSDNPGRVLWTYGPIDAAFEPPAVDHDGTIYIGDFDSRVHAINPDGSSKWTLEIGTDALGPPTIDPSGRILFGTETGEVICLDRSGDRLWTFKGNAHRWTRL